jgi:carboxyl-terminal processing protease
MRGNSTLAAATLWLVSLWVGAGCLHGQDPLYFHVKDLPEVLGLIERNYVDEIDLHQAMTGAVQGALEQVDPGASHIPEGPVEPRLAQRLYEKTGLHLSKLDGYGYVLAVAENSPAAEAGLQPGMMLRTVGALEMRLSSPYRARLEVFSATAPILFRSLEDGKTYTLSPTKWAGSAKPECENLGGLLRIRLPAFTANWSAQIREALRIHQPRKVVLDLRGNAFGGAAELQTLAEIFLAQPLHVELVSRQGSRPVLHSPEKAFSGALFLIQDVSTSAAAEAFCARVHSLKPDRVLGQPSLGLPCEYELLPLATGGYLELSTRAFKVAARLLLREGVHPGIMLENFAGENILAVLPQ